MLWAITSYFNPASYVRRAENFRIFRQRLNLPLIAIELAFDGRFTLQASDADIVLQCSVGDVMWQKERLLNHAARALPDDCRYVVCLDCDVFFANNDWIARLPDALQRTPIIQPYRTIHHLPFGVTTPDADSAFFHQWSMAARIANGASPRDCIAWVVNRHDTPAAPGGAVALRRELLQRHGLYDACIIGGGDLATLAAAYCCHDVVGEILALGPDHRTNYLAWAEPFARAVSGTVGAFLDTDLFHLWHGQPGNRKYQARHQTLRRFDIDPRADLAISDQGPWRWNSPKPVLHQFLKSYFAFRAEDDTSSLAH